MSKTINVSEADIQALRIAQYTIKTGDPADDRAAADAFTRLLGGLGIERKAEPLASIEPPVNVTVQDFPGDSGPFEKAFDSYRHEVEPQLKPQRRGRPRKRAA